MRVTESFRVAFDALRANRLRSLLTMLGVVIGVAAVVVLVAIGGGAKQLVTSEVEGLGSNIVFVAPGKFQLGTSPAISRLQLSDADYLDRVLGRPDAVAVSLASAENLRAGTNTFYATVQGTTANVVDVFDRPVAEGRYVSKADIATARRVIVLGPDAAAALFPNADPIGRQVDMGGVEFRVIGLFQPKGGAFGLSPDSEVHIPVTAAQRLFGMQTISGFATKADSPGDVDATGAKMVDALKQKYRGDEFTAVSQTEILGTIGKILSLLTLVLAAIAGISLLVGGVGVSNIMLVSVRERTKEIGLRKALGARQRDILSQFLLEAVMLTSIGGVIGIGLGIGASYILSAFTPLPAVLAWWSIVLAFGVSAAVGVFFGVMPARRAGRLDPVVALRTE
ncbi:putative ABC transport system permease protein [Catenulispora sp. MAP12-49]|jgi:putative ABC transport system permease protein|uniref:ABC transporter permease n=1 Tax=unclassified Catenulispora TaxID=414885 RepID=UPI0035133BF2